jgi:predicted nucleic acid-binding protein
MTYYADSSFLVSCYLPDANTSRAKNYLRSVGAPLVLNALQALEVGNAFELGVFRGLFSAADATSARANLNQDLRSGRLVKTAVNWPLAFRVASGLSKRHSATTGTRSVDILHVAAAKALRAAEFISFDGRQRLLATALGLKVAP